MRTLSEIFFTSRLLMQMVQLQALRTLKSSGALSFQFDSRSGQIGCRLPTIRQRCSFLWKKVILRKIKCCGHILRRHYN